jgi:hypothetical protein
MGIAAHADVGTRAAPHRVDWLGSGRMC